MKALKHPVFWGGVATLLVVAFGFWVGGLRDCPVVGDCISKFQTFLLARPNEIGDTLAGFAGALAFVWIIVTVWLQSIELAAQREELTLTRLEMEEQRKATQDMARSLAAQAAIFEDEQRKREQLDAQELFDELLGSFWLKIRSHPITEVLWEVPEGHYLDATAVDEFNYLRLFWLRDDDYDEDNLRSFPLSELEFIVRNNRKHLGEVESELVELESKNCIKSKPGKPRELLQVQELLKRLLSLEGKLSDAQKERLRNLQVADIQNSLDRILSAKSLWEQSEVETP